MGVIFATEWLLLSSAQSTLFELGPGQASQGQQSSLHPLAILLRRLLNANIKMAPRPLLPYGTLRALPHHSP